MNKGMNSFENFPGWVIDKWQEIANLLAELLYVPASLIMKTENEYMEVFLSSKSENNPYHVGDKEKWYGLYCETVIATQYKLSIPNATKDTIWNKNPDLKLGMIAYLGFPINFPDNQPFGTLCVLDNKERKFTLNEEKLLLQFKNVIELDLALMQTFYLKTNELAKTITEKQSQLTEKDIEFEKAQKKAVIALQESHQLLKSTFDSLHDAIFIIDSKTLAITDCNQAAAEIFGYNRQEIVGSSTEFLHVNKEALGEFRRQLYKAIEEKGFLFLSGFTMKRKDGNVFPTEHTVVQLLDKQGEQYGWVSVVRDITEQNRNQKELQKAKEKVEESEEKYRSMYNNAPLSYQSLDENGCFIDINPMWSKTLGYERDEVIGKWYGEFLHPEYVEHFRKNFPAFKKRGYVSDVQFKLRKKDNTYIYVSFEGCIGYTPEGKFKQTYCVFKDITEQRALENALIKAKEKAEESERLKNDILEKYHSTQKAANIGNWDWNMVANEIWWSEGTYEIFEVSQEEFIPDFNNNTIFLLPDEIEKYYQVFKNCIENGVWLNHDFTVKTATGKIKFCNNQGKVEYNEKNEPIRFIGTLLDITFRKQTENALLAKMDELERFHNLTVGREITMVELKKEVNNLLNKLGQDNKYKIVE